MTVSNSDVAVSPSAWKSGGKGATVHAFRRSHWASWMFDVDEVKKESDLAAVDDYSGGDDVDDAASTILFGKGGYQGCRGGNGSDWFVENVLELLDSPLEHYIDAQAAPPVLYFQPNSTSSQPEADLVFEVPVLQTLVRWCLHHHCCYHYHYRQQDQRHPPTRPPTHPPNHHHQHHHRRRRCCCRAAAVASTCPLRHLATPRQLVVNASQSAPVRNVTLSGLGFRDAAPTYMEPHAVPSAGDWALERRGAVELEGTEGFSVTGCQFLRNDGNGIMLSGYHRGATVTDSHFAWTGGTAVAVWGRTDELSDNGVHGYDATGGDIPVGTLVQNNIMRESGIWEKQSSCFFAAKAPRSTLLNNLCFNLPCVSSSLSLRFASSDPLWWRCGGSE
jgi:hypothetical protein